MVPFTNEQDPVESLDVSGDGVVSAIDALMVINYLYKNRDVSISALRDAVAVEYDSDKDEAFTQLASEEDALSAATLF